MQNAGPAALHIDSCVHAHSMRAHSNASIHSQGWMPETTTQPIHGCTGRKHYAGAFIIRTYFKTAGLVPSAAVLLPQCCTSWASARPRARQEFASLAHVMRLWVIPCIMPLQAVCRCARGTCLRRRGAETILLMACDTHWIYPPEQSLRARHF